MYPFSLSAIQYTLQQLLSIACLPTSMPFSIQFNGEGSNICVIFPENKTVIFDLLSEKHINQLMQGNLNPLHIHNQNCQNTFPVFFCNPANTIASKEKDALHIHADLISIPFILLSRYEELICDVRDQHGRFPYQQSLAFKYNFIETPIVDEYGLLLRTLLSDFIPDLRITPRQGKVVLTHDVDLLYRFGNLLKNLKSTIGGDLIKSHSFSQMLRSFKDWHASRYNRYNDPLIQAIEQLSQISQQAGLTSTFYIKALHNGNADCTYDINSPELQLCIANLKRQDMNIGLHGSYNSYNDGSILQQEKTSLEMIYGDIICHARQHFLRFDARQSVPAWQACGISNDSTLGFAEHEGFRCGTCHPYPLFDWQKECESNITEHPLIVMDGTMIEYRKLTPESALRQLQLLYKRSMDAEGDLVILWHNHTVYREFEKYFTDVYLPFVQSL